ncbi:hypothetical protein O181_114226 [Austropuccinia psidii MF-1]|uniref:Uncharacterized protein n=1 Tax=Austropuccinia psidii MF-1 TaxID=1389203 RepID=A0A9Q3K6G1_9BASI|nr:hypothetical protein [Austropuccinia psidii MF-1]
MRQDHVENYWPLWKERIISKWEDDSWRFKTENYFEESIFNMEMDRPMSCFLKKTDRLSALHPDMSETIIHRRILRKDGGGLVHAIKSRFIEPFSTEDYINSMEDIANRTKIGRNQYQPPTDNKTTGKKISKQNKPHDKAPLKCQKMWKYFSFSKNLSQKERINEIEIDKVEDKK